MKVALGGIFEISSGGTPSKTHAEYYDGNIPWVKTGDLKSEYLNSVDEYITDEGLKNSSAKMYEPGTVLLAMYGATIGAASILTFNACTNQACAAFKPCKDVIPEYLYYFLLSRREKFIHDGVGGAQPNISGRYLKQVEFELYPINEQRFVISVLDRVNRIISLKKEEIKKLDELIKARFVEMFGSCVNKVLIGDVISICRGASPRPIQAYITESLEGVNWIKIGDVSENSLYITKTAEKITLEGAKKSRAVHAGDFILSNSMSFGRPYILGIDGYVHDGWLILSNFRDTFNELYLYYALRNEYVQQQFHGKVNGATVKNLNSDLVKATYIQVPDMYSQKVFADFVKQIDKSKVAIQKSLAETQLLFDKLMQDYFG